MLALLLCVESTAYGQTRPIISEVFDSLIAIEVTTGGGTSKGLGYLTFDQPAGKAREFYGFFLGPSFQTLTRYDLGAIYHIDLPTCDVTEVTGTMPPTWAWIQQAKQGDTEVIDDMTVVFWVAPGGSTGETKRIGVSLDDSTTPVVYEEITPDRSVRVRFLTWRTLKPNATLFNPPRLFCSR